MVAALRLGDVTVFDCTYGATMDAGGALLAARAPLGSAVLHGDSTYRTYFRTQTATYAAVRNMKLGFLGPYHILFEQGIDHTAFQERKATLHIDRLSGIPIRNSDTALHKGYDAVGTLRGCGKFGIADFVGIHSETFHQDEVVRHLQGVAGSQNNSSALQGGSHDFTGEAAIVPAHAKRIDLLGGITVQNQPRNELSYNGRRPPRMDGKYENQFFILSYAVTAFSVMLFQFICDSAWIFTKSSPYPFSEPQGIAGTCKIEYHFLAVCLNGLNATYITLARLQNTIFALTFASMSERALLKAAEAFS